MLSFGRHSAHLYFTCLLAAGIVAGQHAVAAAAEPHLKSTIRESSAPVQLNAQQRNQ